jgi:hypothetical protein
MRISRSQTGRSSNLCDMPQPLDVEQSRAIPIGRDAAFNGTLDMQLPVVCRRRYGILPPISRMGQEGNWGTVGQTRTLAFRGGGSLRETLTNVDRPRSWSYTLSDFTGPLAALLSQIEGEFMFSPAGTGTRITWRYIVRARSSLAAPVLPLFAWSWRGYARQTLEELSDLHVA